MDYSSWYIVNLIKKEILKGMSHSDPQKKSKNEQKSLVTRVMTHNIKENLSKRKSWVMFALPVEKTGFCFSGSPTSLE